MDNTLKSPTRADYMDGRVDFQAYYEAIGATHGMFRIVAALSMAGITDERVAVAWNQDRALNTIPIKTWDRVGKIVLDQGGIVNAFKAHGDGCSEAGLVCVAKAVARWRMSQGKRDRGIIHLVERAAERVTKAEYYINVTRTLAKRFGALNELRAAIVETGVTVDQIKANAANAWAWPIVDSVYSPAAERLMVNGWVDVLREDLLIHGDQPTQAGLEFVLIAVGLHWAGLIPQESFS